MNPSVTINRTTELRWFFEGPTPADVLQWFMAEGRGLTESRRDHYLRNDLDDVGVKRRDGLTLERKARLGPPAVMSLGIGAIGIVETWERWSPADLMIDLGDDQQWLDVDKSIIKRRFGLGGNEAALSEQNRAMSGDACDAEVASLHYADTHYWTFALASVGRLHTHHRTLSIAWEALAAAGDLPESLTLATQNSAGYPQWLRTAPRSTLLHASRSRPLHAAS